MRSNLGRKGQSWGETLRLNSILSSSLICSVKSLFYVECERHGVGVGDYSCSADPGREYGLAASSCKSAAPSPNGKCAPQATVTIVVQTSNWFKVRLFEGWL